MSAKPKNPIPEGPLPVDPESQFEWLCNYAKRKLGWYWHNIDKKRRWSKAIRYFSIILLAIAGLLPVLQTVTTEECIWGIAIEKLPNWGYIFLGIAGALNLLDRQTGMSSGYLRYVATSMEIERLYHEFVHTWHSLLDKDDERDPDLHEELYALVGTYKKKIDEEEKTETEAWITEFQTAQSELNALLKSKTNEYKKISEEDQRAQHEQHAKDRKIIVVFENYDKYQSAIILPSKDGKALKTVSLTPIQEQKVISGLKQGSYEIEIEATSEDPTLPPYKNQVVVDLNQTKEGKAVFKLKKY